MESEHTQFASSQPESDAPDTQESANTTPEQNPQAEQATTADENAQAEASGARPHRRRRTSRSSAHHSRAAATEPSSEETEHTEAPAEPAAWETAPAPEAAAAAPAEQESAAPASDESAWSFQHWREQPPTDWNPFLPHTSESQEPAFSIPGEPSDVTGDAETASWNSPEAEVTVETNVEVIDALPVEEIVAEAPAAEATPEQASEAPQEPFRAPLSGVEVRPPRRYRFDRPSPATQEAPARGTHQSRSHATTHAAQTRETPRAASGAESERSAPAAVDKEASAEPLTDNKLEAAIEREMTETPEIEADVVAAEELARATQAALEEEVAEALESFTATTPATGQRTGRRRKRRSGSSSSAAASTAAETAEKAQAPAPQPTPSHAQAPQPYTPPTPQPYSAPAPQPYAQPYTPAMQDHQVSNGLQQIGQPQSPFGGPEPSSARGFGPVPRGVAMPAERSVRMPRPAPERTVETSNVSANQLAMIFTQAIQQQTDRLLMELRRSQGTPSMTVNFPPMPSNERIGVFVDVANLLYSARNMRIGIDFGRLLDFLRGNRRLVRAHAYCPTSPDPRAEQMFLDAVKGLGYRITTKNYKTFSSGAKKADLDLDLCMDIVRLVDSGSVDCISLVSGDSDFLPLLEYCSDHGVRVEVAAFDEATASILRQSCDLFINLSMVEEIRA
ncbi:MAG TPA: NYN domain-containing protein [Ktedonobacterales bacterium]|nr:NYN domain-containing protein [Ktedonobacterales bacterium]